MSVAITARSQRILPRTATQLRRKLLAAGRPDLISSLTVTAEELNDRCIARLQTADIQSRLAVVGSGPSSPYIARIETLEAQLSACCGVAKDAAEEFCCPGRDFSLKGRHEINWG